jgi:hypothetical protein
MTKPTFEDALLFIENELDIQLLQFQKEILRIMFEKENSYFVPSRFCGRRLYLENLKLINQLLTKER